MNLAEYKKLVKGYESAISDAADAALLADWRIGSTGALNKALSAAGLAHPAFLCRHEGTANAVLQHCDRKARKD